MNGQSNRGTCLTIGFGGFCVAFLIASLVIPDAWLERHETLPTKRLLAALIGATGGLAAVLVYIHFLIPHPLRVLFALISASVTIAGLVAVRVAGLSRVSFTHNPPGVELIWGGWEWAATGALLGSLGIAASLSVFYAVYAAVARETSFAREEGKKINEREQNRYGLPP